MKLKMRGRLFPFLLLLLIFPGYADAQLEGCLSYDPAVVKLAGTISKKTFPGPPNYESIRKGDQPETYRVLHLASPICTTASGDNEAESGVTDLQLILTRKQYALSKKFAGRRVRMTVTGKLSHAITGHHHTPVLLEVTGISSVR